MAAFNKSSWAISVKAKISLALFFISFLELLRQHDKLFLSSLKSPILYKFLASKTEQLQFLFWAYILKEQKIKNILKNNTWTLFFASTFSVGKYY